MASKPPATSSTPSPPTATSAPQPPAATSATPARPLPRQQPPATHCHVSDPQSPTATSATRPLPRHQPLPRQHPSPRGGASKGRPCGGKLKAATARAPPQLPHHTDEARWRCVKKAACGGGDISEAIWGSGCHVSNPQSPDATWHPSGGALKRPPLRRQA